jgi:hypothetical protein
MRLDEGVRRQKLLTKDDCEERGAAAASSPSGVWGSRRWRPQAVCSCHPRNLGLSGSESENRTANAPLVVMGPSLKFGLVREEGALSLYCCSSIRRGRGQGPLLSPRDATRD